MDTTEMFQNVLDSIGRTGIPFGFIGSHFPKSTIIPGMTI